MRNFGSQPIVRIWGIFRCGWCGKFGRVRKINPDHPNPERNCQKCVEKFHVNVPRGTL
jgi:hypothetical protein